MLVALVFALSRPQIRADALATIGVRLEDHLHELISGPQLATASIRFDAPNPADVEADRPSDTQPIPYQRRLERIVDRNLTPTTHLTPEDVRRTIWPAIRRTFPEARWDQCKPTFGRRGLILELTLPFRDNAILLSALIWKQGSRLHCQVLQDIGNLMDVDVEDGFVSTSEAFLERDRLICLGMSHGMGNWEDRKIRIYTRHASVWKLSADEDLGTDNGESAIHFYRRAGKPIPNRIVDVSQVALETNLSESKNGLTLLDKRIWTIRGTVIVPGKHVRLNTAYSALSHLADLVAKGDRVRFRHLVPKKFQHLLWTWLDQWERNYPLRIHASHRDAKLPSNEYELLTFPRYDEPQAHTPVYLLRFKLKKGNWRLTAMKHRWLEEFK